MRSVRRSGVLAVVVFSAALMAACGDSKSPTTPTPPPSGGGNPPPPTTPANRNPVIGNLTISPDFAVSELTTVNFSASASDPDGDPVSYKWELNTTTGGVEERQSFAMRFGGNGGTLIVKLTVSDGKGGTATQTRNYAIGSMSGSWRGSGQIIGTFSLNLTQRATQITGTMATVLGPGQLDPAQPGTIDAQGNVQMRVKTSIYTDFNFRGRMDASGTRITGQMFGSGFNGETFTLTKQ